MIEIDEYKTILTAMKKIVQSEQYNTTLLKKGTLNHVKINLL